MEPAPTVAWIKEFGPTGSMAALAFYLIVIIIPKMQTEWRDERKAERDSREKEIASISETFRQESKTQRDAFAAALVVQQTACRQELADLRDSYEQQIERLFQKHLPG